VTRRLLLGYVALTFVVLVVLEVPLGVLNAHNQRQDLRVKVARDATTLGTLAEDALEHGRVHDAALRAAVAHYAESTDAQVAIRDTLGHVIANSATGDEAEHVTGLTLTHRIVSGRQVLGTVRITYPTGSVEHHIARFWLALAIVGAAVLAAAALVGLLLARSLARPLRRLEEAAEQVGDGALDARAPEDDGPEEIRRLARTLNETTAKLEALVKTQQDFVTDASHELRTPLTALRLRLENLEHDVARDGHESLAAAIAEVERLTRVISELLALSRAEVQPAESVDVAALAAARADAWNALADERGVAIDAGGGAVRARAGTGRLEQVLDNLLANALEVSPRGGAIRVSAQRADGWVELHVVDEGPGLSEAERTRAFGRFWRSGGGEGSGLGLAIVSRLVRIDEGEVELLAADTGGVDAVVRLRPS